MKYFEYLQNTKIQLFILGLVILFSLYKTTSDNNKRENFKEQESFTTGTIIGHNLSGIAETYYVKYTYVVNGKVHIKSVNYSKNFIDCYKTKNCIGKKFVVYYNKDNPEEAFIDFDNEE